MDEVNRIGTALRVGWKEEINNNNRMTNEVRIFSGCVCVLCWEEILDNVGEKEEVDEK